MKRSAELETPRWGESVEWLRRFQPKLFDHLMEYGEMRQGDGRMGRERMGPASSGELTAIAWHLRNLLGGGR